jgi:uncharacterized membrane protein HdeD (DUF308 family)
MSQFVGQRSDVPAARFVWIQALRGVLAVLFGIVTLLWPAVTVIALALLFGVYAAVDGISLLVAAVRERGDRWRRFGLVLMGLLGIAAAVIALVWPHVTALVLAIVIGAWALVAGAGGIWVGLRRGDWLTSLIGLISVVAGVLILVRPAAGAIAVAIVIGAYALVAGILLIVSAWLLHRSLSGAPPHGAAPAPG